jgi:hypothetical protein
MGSSGGGGGNPALLMQGGIPAQGLPVAGSGGSTVDPTNYGKFQNFLPDADAAGNFPLATGLKSDMFKFRSPNGTSDSGTNAGSGGTGSGMDVNTLRNLLAQLQGGGGGGGAGPFSGSPTDGPHVLDLGGGGGGGGFAGMGSSPLSVGGGGGAPMMGGGNLDPTGGNYSRPGVAGFDAFAPWQAGGGNAGIRAGGSNMPIDWQNQTGPLIAQPKTGM